jgi:hypothetical protein
MHHSAALRLGCQNGTESPVPKHPSPHPPKGSSRPRTSAKAPRISVCLTPDFASEITTAARHQGASVSWFAQRLMLRGWQEYKRDGRL